MRDGSRHFNYRFNILETSLHYQTTALFSQQGKQTWPKINEKKNGLREALRNQFHVVFIKDGVLTNGLTT
jgi:hypothetical protein